MLYLFILFFLVPLVCFSLIEHNQVKALKKKGVRLPGVIVANEESSKTMDEFSRLGGNINTPTVRFVTKDGHIITGEPIQGFVTQHEVVPPVRVLVIYEAKDPQRFCLEFS